MRTHMHTQAAATEGAGDGGKGVVFTSTVEFSSLLQARWVNRMGDGWNESIDRVCLCGWVSDASHGTHRSLSPVPTPLPK